MQSLTEYLAFAKAQAAKGDNFHLSAALQLKQYPVSVNEFITGKQYLNDTSIYPANLKALEKLNNPEGLRIGTPYTEAVLGGGIGVGKTTMALVSIAYQVYVLNCLKNPQKLFDLSDNSEIAFVIQSPTERLAKAVGYGRLREIISNSKCFRGFNGPNTKLKSELHFRNGVVIRPLSGDTTAALGQNVFGGLLDEIAFAEFVENSQRARDKDVYDQARGQYAAISKRRKSRFLKKGRLPGLLCLVSSPQHHDDLLSHKLKQAKSDESMFTYQKRLWDVKGENYHDQRFKVFVGTPTRPPRILADGEALAEEDAELVDAVPIDFLKDYQRDIDGAIRDLSGRPSTAVSPFLRNKTAVIKAFQSESMFNLESIDFSTQRLIRRQGVNFPDPGRLRWVHVDLAQTRDSAGLVMGHVQSFHNFDGEVKPVIMIDAVLEVRPPEIGEIDFQKIRNLINRLNTRVELKFVTYDQYQSTDSLQILRNQGFSCGVQSMDRTTEPYEFLRAAIYEGRVLMPRHQKLLRELLALEYDARKIKIDHPMNGSKDVADCLAGVVYGLTNRREVWTQLEVMPRRVRLNHKDTVMRGTPELVSNIHTSDSPVHAAFLAEMIE